LYFIAVWNSRWSARTFHGKNDKLRRRYCLFDFVSGSQSRIKNEQASESSISVLSTRLDLSAQSAQYHRKKQFFLYFVPLSFALLRFVSHTRHNRKRNLLSLFVQNNLRESERLQMSAISSLSSFSYQASRGTTASPAAQRGGTAQQAQRGTTTASTFSSGSAARGSSGSGTYTCPICGQQLPVGVSHDQFHSGTSSARGAAASSTANTKGQALGSAASRAATAYGGASAAGRTPAFNQSATIWAR
jgi:hypothetical protein